MSSLKEKDSLIKELKNEIQDLRDKVSELQGKAKDFSGSSSSGGSDLAVSLVKDDNGTYQLVKISFDPNQQTSAVKSIVSVGKDFAVAAYKAKEVLEMDIIFGISKRHK